MTQGGARNRSGKAIDPTSGYAERKGVVLAALPADGWADPAPKFPLPEPSKRELALWKQIWAYPQAAAWSSESWRWQAVAMWVRISVQCELREPNAALLGQLHRFADQIGLTPAGLKENGWKIAAEKPAATDSEPDSGTGSDVRSRMRVVQGGA